MKLAVEWLVKELESMDTKSYNRLIQIEMDRDNFIQICEQAKEMQKQQIVDAFEIGYENGACVNKNNDFYHGGNYYNETFKSE